MAEFAFRLALALVGLAMLLSGIVLAVLAVRDGVDVPRQGRWFISALFVVSLAIVGFGPRRRRSRSEEIMERAHRQHRIGRFRPRWVVWRIVLGGVAIVLAVVQIVVAVQWIIEANQAR